MHCTMNIITKMFGADISCFKKKYRAANFMPILKVLVGSYCMNIFFHYFFVAKIQQHQHTLAVYTPSLRPHESAVAAQP